MEPLEMYESQPDGFFFDFFENIMKSACVIIATPLHERIAKEHE